MKNMIDNRPVIDLTMYLTDEPFSRDKLAEWKLKNDSFKCLILKCDNCTPEMVDRLVEEQKALVDMKSCQRILDMVSGTTEKDESFLSDSLIAYCLGLIDKEPGENKPNWLDRAWLIYEPAVESSQSPYLEDYQTIASNLLDSCITVMTQKSSIRPLEMAVARNPQTDGYGIIIKQGDHTSMLKLEFDNGMLTDVTMGNVPDGYEAVFGLEEKSEDFI